ncbi:protein misato [Phlebotomus argentipes]|uniref:protein misato n=1 Tax=Phlebotomus argentipes TaxID=94469 RepID=UPI002892AEFB|nr:protein misato [Phlebotomus argentipes]
MKTREILTLQFGNYANYVGTHFWNIQEAGFQYEPGATVSEVNHDVLFREGQNHRGDVTYTPRMLSMDLKGALAHLSEDGDLYDDESAEKVRSGNSEALTPQIPWNSQNIEIVQAPVTEKPAYQKDLQTSGGASQDYNFQSTVKSWTDFMYSRYHPRSLNVIQEYSHSDEENTFDTFTNGRELWKSGSFDEDFCDKIRQYIEECDNCQGFQVLFDCIDGFSGLSAKCFEELSDEYGKSILAYPLIPPHMRNFKNADTIMSCSIRVVNIALSFVSLIESTSLFVPLSTMAQGWRNVAASRQFPNVSYNPENAYQTSAILATFLDTLTLKYRAKDILQPLVLSEFCADLNAYGWKMCAADLGFPFDAQIPDVSDGLNDLQTKPIFTHLTPNSEISRGQIMKTMIRGVHRSQIASTDARGSHQSADLSFFPYGEASFKLQRYLESLKCANSVPVMTYQTPMPVKVPYPDEIFSKNINVSGYESHYMREEGVRVSSIPVLAAVSATKHLMGTIDSLHAEAEKVKLSKVCRFRETGLEADEYGEVLHKLLDFRDLYDDHVQL